LPKVFHVIASEAKQSSFFAGLPAGLFSGLFYLDCFASLAMTRYDGTHEHSL